MQCGNEIDDWVVTYRVEFPQPSVNKLSMTVVEFFRGSEQECRRIMNAFGGGSSDLAKTNPWQVVIGPVKDWEDFLADTC